MTFGVRGVIHDAGNNAVFLVRHTYVPGWHFPGGGVEAGETALESLGLCETSSDHFDIFWGEEYQAQSYLTTTKPHALVSYVPGLRAVVGARP